MEVVDLSALLNKMLLEELISQETARKIEDILDAADNEMTCCR